MTSARETRNELIGLGRHLRDAIPGVYTAYAQMHNATMGDGALPARVKELIAHGRVVHLRVSGVHAGDRVPQMAAKADQLFTGLAGRGHGRSLDRVGRWHHSTPGTEGARP